MARTHQFVAVRSDDRWRRQRARSDQRERRNPGDISSFTAKRSRILLLHGLGRNILGNPGVTERNPQPSTSVRQIGRFRWHFSDTGLALRRPFTPIGALSAFPAVLRGRHVATGVRLSAWPEQNLPDTSRL